MHENILWKPLIKIVSSKVAKSIGIITKYRQFLLSNTLSTLYNTFLSSVLFNYLVLHVLIISLSSLLPSKKVVLRIFTHSPPRTHTCPLFKKFRLLNHFFYIYKYQVACIIFLHMQKALSHFLISLSQYRMSSLFYSSKR